MKLTVEPTLGILYADTTEPPERFVGQSSGMLPTRFRGMTRRMRKRNKMYGRRLDALVEWSRPTALIARVISAVKTGWIEAERASVLRGRHCPGRDEHEPREALVKGTRFDGRPIPDGSVPECIHCGALFNGRHWLTPRQTGIPRA